MSARKRARKFTWREVWPIWLTFGILFGVGILGERVLVPAAQPPAKTLRQGEDVTLRVEELQPDLAKLFAYPLESSGTTEFFVERNAAYGITVAFASCRRCYRAGHYRQGGQILCRQCNEPMERVTSEQTPAAEKDCTQIPIPFDRSGDVLTIRASAVGETFRKWYVPVIARDGNFRIIGMLLATALAMPFAQLAVPAGETGQKRAESAHRVGQDASRL